MVSADSLIETLNSLGDSPVNQIVGEQVFQALSEVSEALGNGSRNERIFKQLINFCLSALTNGGNNG